MIITQSPQRRKARVVNDCYIAAFCFVTRAVYLGIVSDLTFKAYLRRFVIRRGLCKILNATNFAGTKNQLQNISKNPYTLEITVVKQGITQIVV